MLLIFRCLRKGESEDIELALVGYIECVASLDELDKALGCMCLQCATAGCRDAKHDLEDDRED